ncbi:lipocalin family protein [Spirosoma taeanense]|uniref:Lipocalin family protein n=1 Tax=Spirosoma taeanense TaxID=2735870 RepID=A0A6M5Y4I8_9BACT|nr:lipocalin family protein [Spirosoma taeanense]QJW88719.1 lipocalin family protein [Spirosoma taeanense]
MNTVRLLALMLVIALPMWFGSCKKDGTEAVMPTNTSVEGNYKVSAIKVDPKIEGFDDILPLYSLLLGNTCLTDITISFKSNGTITTDYPPSCQSAGDDISDATGIDSDSKWALNGSKLTITDENGTQTAYDATFNGGNMQLKWQEDDGDASGKTFKQTYIMELKRL